MKTTVLFLLILSSLNGFAQEFPYITLEGHAGSVNSVAFSPDGLTLASGSDDNTIRLWNVRTGETERTLEGHTWNVTSVAFSPDGLTLASGSDDNTIRLWNVRTGETQRTLGRWSSRVLSIAFSPDGQTLAGARFGGDLHLWNVSTGEVRLTLESHTNRVNSVAFSPDGQTLASGSDDEIIRLWNVHTGETQNTLRDHRFRSVNSVAFSPNGLMLANAISSIIRFWDGRTGYYLHTHKGHKGTINSVTFSPDSLTLASGSDDNTIRLWNARTGETLRTLRGHTGDVNSVAFSPNGLTLASGSEDNTIRLWDVPDTRVSISPSPIESPPVGEQFQIKVNINSGQNVRGYRLTVGYDSNAIKYVSHAYGVFLPGDLFMGSEDTRSGRVSLNVTSPAGVGNGDGTLATMTFEVVSRTASNLYLSATLSGDDGESLFHSAESGKVIEPPWDVNGDGAVDIFDLAIIAARFGQPGEKKADVNGDGAVDILDLVVVASGMDAAAAAPAVYTPAIFTASEVQGWLAQARQLNLVDATVQRGIYVLENLLAALNPRETALLPNYPNPFNPETWIPYHLAHDANVTITICDIKDAVVRQLNLGHQPAGHYTDRGYAGYWDGRNESGESVASGVYFYRLQADNFSATRKMLILK